MRPVVMAVAGGTGSGKTTVAREILHRVGAEHIAYIPHDAYYRDLAHLPQHLRELVNFDHPDSLETELLIEHVKTLKTGRAIDIPVYDFTTHTRTRQTRHVAPAPVVLVEGILVLAEPRLREQFDAKLYVDTDADVRFIRRLRRDLAERGRTVESVCEQYLSTVRPMHLEFVEQSKRHADVIIPEGGLNEVAIAMVAARVHALLEEHER